MVRGPTGRSPVLGWDWSCTGPPCAARRRSSRRPDCLSSPSSTKPASGWSRLTPPLLPCSTWWPSARKRSAGATPTSSCRNLRVSYQQVGRHRIEALGRDAGRQGPGARSSVAFGEEVEEALHRGRLNENALRRNLRHMVGPDRIPAQPLQDQFHARRRNGVVLGDDGTVHAQNFEDQGGQDAGAVLAGGAVKDQGLVRRVGDQGERVDERTAANVE